MKIPVAIESILKLPDMAVVRGAVAFLIARFLGISLVFGLQILVARLLGVVEYGVYTYVMTWVAILSLVGIAGMDFLYIRYVAIYRSAQAWSLMAGVRRFGFVLVLLASLLVSALSAALIYSGIFALDSHLQKVFLVALAALPVYALSGLRYGFFRGLNMVVAAEIPEGIVRPLLLGAAFLWFGVVQRGTMDAYHAMLLSVMAATVVWIIGEMWMARLPMGRPGAEGLTYEPRLWMLAALPFLLSALLSLVLNRVDIVMLGALSGMDHAGIYSAASRLSEFVSFGLVAVGAASGPRIASCFSAGRMTELQGIVATSSRIAFVLAAVAAIILVISGVAILQFWGKGFETGYASLVILVIAQLVNVGSGLVGMIMAMTGHQNQSVKIMLGVLAANIVLNFWLIPLFGMVGAAIATAVALVAWNLIMLVYVRRVLRINPAII